MVVSVLILQIIVVSLLALKRGLEPRVFGTTAFLHAFIVFYCVITCLFFYVRFFESGFGFEPLALEPSWGSTSASKPAFEKSFSKRCRRFTVFFSKPEGQASEF